MPSTNTKIINLLYANEDQAVAGIDNETISTPLRTAQAIQALSQDYTCFNVARQLGVTPDGVTNMTPFVAEAINIVAATGGGIVYLSPGTWLFNTITDPIADQAAIVLQSNVYLQGAGRGATKLQWYGGQGHLISAKNILNWGISHMSLAGGRDKNITTDGYHVIRGDTVDQFLLEDLFIEEALFYGIGFQNGSITYGWLKNIHTYRTGSDGIDFKNKAGDANWGPEMNSIYIQDFDRRNEGGKAGLDIRGPGTLTNIQVRSDFTTDSVGIRTRHGESGDPNGAGGHYTSVSAFLVEDTGTKLGTGVCIAARNSQMGQGSVLNCGTGGWITELAEDSGLISISAKECTNGFLIDGVNNIADFCRAKDCATSYRVRGMDCGVFNSRSRDATVRGYFLENTSINPELINNYSSNDLHAFLDLSLTSLRRNNIGFQNTDEVGFKDTRYYGSNFVGASTTLLVIENRLYFIPLELFADITADQIAFSVNIAAGDIQCQARLGLYRFQDGEPETLLIDYGIKTIGIGVGTQSIALGSLNYWRGKYAVGLIFNRNGGATGIMPILNARTTINSVSRTLFGSSGANFSSSAFEDAMYSDIAIGTWADYILPNPAPAITFNNDNVPFTSFRAT